MTVVLYQVNGACYPLPDDAWRLALEMARAGGWNPAGTLGPPVSLEGRERPAWDGSYGIASGQEVTRADAARFAAALERDGSPEWLAELARFATRGGFLVCAAQEPVAGSLLRLADRIGVVERVEAETSARPARG